MPRRSRPRKSSRLGPALAAALGMGGCLGSYLAVVHGLQSLGLASEPSAMLGGGAVALGWPGLQRLWAARGWPYSEARAREAIRQASSRATDLTALAGTLAGIVERLVPTARTGLWLPPAGEPSFHLVGHRGPAPGTHVIPEFTLRQLTRERLGRPWRAEPHGEGAFDELMRQLGARTCLPLVYQGQLIGLVTLGKPARGRELQPRDQETLARLGPALAEALALHQLRAEQAMHLSKLEAVSRLYMDAQKKAITDGLTGLTTHQHFQEQLAKRFYEARRYGQPLSLMFLDIDFFKKINDTYGHLTGDVVLRQVAHTVQASARACDTVARYGGEELAMLLPQTDLEGAYILAERLRQAIHQLRVPEATGDRLISVTVSIGLAELAADRTPAELLDRADQCVYTAKHRGRNRVVRSA